MAIELHAIKGHTFPLVATLGCGATRPASRTVPTCLLFLIYYAGVDSPGTEFDGARTFFFLLFFLPSLSLSSSLLRIEKINDKWKKEWVRKGSSRWMGSDLV
jgi:hypothetical protein